MTSWVSLLVALQACAWGASPSEGTQVRDLQDADCRLPSERGETPANTAWDASPLQLATSDASERAPLEPLTVMTWNLHWFQHRSEGPTDDEGQYRAVRDVIAGSGGALIGLQEVASEPAFDRLLADLPAYAGVLSGHDWPQRTALLWLRTDFELTSARPVSGLDDAGRPPLELVLHDRKDDTPWIVVVVHAKAQADASSHATRVRFAEGLAQHLRGGTSTERLIVLGDFNDRLDGSITDDAATSYGPFVDDTQHFATPTRALNDPNAAERSYAWGATIDHIVLSADLGPRVSAGSVDVLREELLPRYPHFVDAVSDHFPVVLMLER